MKVTIYTAFNRRPAVSRLFCMGITRFIQAAPPGVTCNVHVVISEEESIALCNEFGFTFTRHPNTYLGQKWNVGMEALLKEHQPNYVLIMGDDDLLSNEAWKGYAHGMGQGWPYFGFNSIYFYSPAYGKARLYNYRQTAHERKLWGCGRMISANAIERSGWHSEVKFKKDYDHGGVRFDKDEVVSLPYYQAQYFTGMKVAEATPAPRAFTLWEPTQQKGLDNESEIKLLMNGYDPIAFEHDSGKALMVDIKTASNLWDYTHYISLGVGAPVEDALAFLTDEERTYIQQHFAGEEVVKLPCKEFPIGIRTAEQIAQQEGNKIIATEYARKNSNATLPIKIKLVQFPDHPMYYEAWYKFKTPDTKFICGIHIEQEADTLRLHVVSDVKMSKGSQI